MTTAVVLQERGHRVQVVAAATGDGTTSAAAGAVWYPFRADPPERVIGWAMRSKDWLTGLADSTPEAGVDLVTTFEIVASTERPWWAACAPDLELVARHLPDGSPYAWQFLAPRIEPALHLAWLESQLRWPIERRRVVSLDAEPGDVVVNCTGLAARVLTGDRELQGLFGQTVVVRPGAIDIDTVVVDEREHERMFYSIPRRDTVVLGGCADAVNDDYSLEPDADFTAEILERARLRGFEPGVVVRAKCGLRPYRTTVRLERDDRIIHNYGHGGAGYTLARGCAEEVAELV
ncbi:MAG: FAD-dependent oxidoreductase, partial [bacterium]